MSDEQTKVDALRERIAEAVQEFAFEPNNDETYEKIRVKLTKLVENEPDIYDYVVACDKYTNMIHKRELRAFVLVKPFNDEEQFHYIPVRLYNGINDE